MAFGVDFCCNSLSLCTCLSALLLFVVWVFLGKYKCWWSFWRGWFSWWLAAGFILVTLISFHAMVSTPALHRWAETFNCFSVFISWAALLQLGLVLFSIPELWIRAWVSCFNGLEFIASVFLILRFFPSWKQMEYLSSFCLASKRLFSAPLCPYSNIAICVTIAPHTS